MYEGKEKRKKYRMARLHEAVVNARERGLPGKLAELGALCVSVGAGIWSAQHGRMIVGSAVAMFVLYSLVLQVVSRLVFLTISLITRPAYNIFMKHARNNGGYQEWNSKNFTRHNKYRRYQEKDKFDNKQSRKEDQSQQNNQYRQTQKNEGSAGSKNKDSAENSNTYGMSEDAARVLFGLGETFTLEELKIVRNKEMKRCHPDQNMNGDHTDVGEERTKKVNQAYAILKKLVQEKQTA